MSSSNRTLSPLEPLVEAVESAEVLDGPAIAVNKAADRVLRKHPLKDAISGTALGHALHPMLTDVVIGSFLSATALDLIGGKDSAQASERLIALGIAAYPPTAVTGTSDWTDGGLGNVPVRRIGIAHAALNSAALAMYAGSLAARRKGRRGRGVALGMAGAGALGAAGFLGGHLTLAKGVGVDQTAFDRDPGEWVDVASATGTTENKPVRVSANGTPVFLVRRDNDIHAVHDRCSHRGCSLAERGEIVGDEIICHCHGSRFALADGALRKGPATRPQPAYEARERDGRIQLRRRTIPLAP